MPTLSQLCEILEVEFHGDGDTEVKNFRSLDQREAGSLVMVENSQQLQALEGSDIAAILHPEELEVTFPGIAHNKPRVILAKILRHFHPRSRPEPGIHATATVDSRAEIDPSATVGPFCVIGPQSRIAAGVHLVAYVAVGEDSQVGQGSILGPHVVLASKCQVGRDCQLEAWAKLGKAVRIDDGVDVGAHSSLGDEVHVQMGAKIDNLVLVGPRSVVGPGSLLIGQSAVDRDATLHSGVIVAGQGSVGPEAVLHSGVQVGGRSLATGVLKEAGPYLGTPAIPLKDEMRRRVLEKKKARDAKNLELKKPRPK